MKTRILLMSFAFAMFLVQSLYSQNVAINTNGNAPHASAMLDIQSTTGGLLIPRLTESAKTNILNPATGLMIFQTDGTSGFWYYNGTAWTQLLDGNSDNIYTTDGTLSGNRIITQDDNDLTFETGTGRTIIDGNFETKGAVYAKVRTINAAASPNWQADDLVVLLTFPAPNPTYLTLPNPALYTGRVLFIRNNSVEGGTGGTITYQTYVPVNNTSIAVSRGQMLISNGTSWYLVAGI
ncbi:MAG: hypothetical protein PHT69_16650 [Bacteroidales bacterium]|nr:hypothetical protein [Bacteroidales bacterium]